MTVAFAYWLYILATLLTSPTNYSRFLRFPRIFHVNSHAVCTEAPSLLFLTLFVAFALFSVVTGLSHRTVLTRPAKAGWPWPLHCCYGISCGVFGDALPHAEGVSCLQFAESYREWAWNFVKCSFCICWNCDMVFFLFHLLKWLIALTGFCMLGQSFFFSPKLQRLLKICLFIYF